MVDQDRLFARLARSTFRSRFRLGGKERQYCLDKGPEIIDRHAADFIRQRLAPAAPINDEVGEIPRYALMPDGEMTATSLFYKFLP